MESLIDKSRLPGKLIALSIPNQDELYLLSHPLEKHEKYIGPNGLQNGGVMAENVIAFSYTPRKLYDKIIDTYPGIVRTFIKYLTSRRKGSKYVIYVDVNRKLILTIYDYPLEEIKRQLNNINIKSTIDEGFIIIPNIDYNAYYVLNLILERLPSWKDLTYEDIDPLEYFLENNPEFVLDYVKRNPNQFVRFAELVKEEPSYFDIIINEGVKILEESDNIVSAKDTMIIKSIIANILLSKQSVGKMSESNLALVLKYLIEGEITAYNQDLINKLYAQYIGFPFGQTLGFDIKLNVETLLKIGKLIKK